MPKEETSKKFQYILHRCLFFRLEQPKGPKKVFLIQGYDIRYHGPLLIMFQLISAFVRSDLRL